MSNVKNSDKQSNEERKAFKLKFFNSKNVSILFLFFTIFFIFLAIIIFYAQKDIYKFNIDYTNCKFYSNKKQLNQSFSNRIRSKSGSTICNFRFNMPKDSYEMVYIHYQMHDFYKNFHTFSKSYSENQLFGDFNLIVLNQCRLLKPIDYELNEKCAITPCGELPNFIFNDSIQIFYEFNDSIKVPIHINTYNISESLFRLNFNNPNEYDMQLIKNHTEKPPNWSKSIFELDLKENSNNGFQNEQLIVWMYPNTFAEFSKLYGRITTRFDEQIKKRLPKKLLKKYLKDKKIEQSPFLRKGIYNIRIVYNYPLWSNLAKKGFSISTVGPFGQNNLIFKIFICLASIVSFLSMIIVYLIFRLHDNRYRSYISDNSNVDFLF